MLWAICYKIDDYGYSSTLQIFTEPKNGYTSVSTVNLSFIGYLERNLPEGFVFNKFLTLAAPYLPCDGMNEKGVAIAFLSVPKAEASYDSHKITLNISTAMRLVLDKVATVDEAVELLQKYNIYFSDDMAGHYLIANASGKSVLVEYYDNELQIVETDSSYQITSNFIAYDKVNIGGGGTGFQRYDTVEKEILDNNGVLNEDSAVSLLVEVGVGDGILINCNGLLFMLVGFIIWSIVASIFMLIGISAWKSKQEVGFFTFSKPPKMKDVVKYNHAVGKLWFSFATILEIIGIPFLSIEQNSPISILIIFEVMILVIAIIIIYLRIEKKYRQQ